MFTEALIRTNACTWPLNFHELLHALVNFLLTMLASGDLTHVEIQHVMVLLLLVELRLIKQKNKFF